MEQETRKEFNRVIKERYKWRNKPGKHLAKILINKKTLNYKKIKNERGEMVYKTTDIAKAFQTYYSALYSIRNKETQKEEETRQIKIQEYLADAKLTKIQVE